MPFKERFSENNRINSVIEHILDELCPFLEEQAREISQMTAIGKALGDGRNIQGLLEKILSIAKRFTRADGGTLYMVNPEQKLLEFQVFQNNSLDLKSLDHDTDLPGVPLFNPDGSANMSNVSSYVYHTGKVVNIADIYKTQRFRFDGTKNFDRKLLYKSHSMVVIPMTNHENDIIGVLQLINAKDTKTDNIVCFDTEAEEKAAALASQASIILTQQMLILEMNALFEAFIKAIAVTIDEKSRHTGGHIQRVTELALMIADSINNDQSIYKDRYLTDIELDELRMASLMHDTGKITTPDHIITKAFKLETVFNRIELLKTRWELFKAENRLNAAEMKLSLLDPHGLENEFDRIEKKCLEANALLDQELQTLCAINTHKNRLTDPMRTSLNIIARKSKTIDGKDVPYLEQDEIENLSIERGTLTSDERKTIKNHAFVTEKILSQLPWPKGLKKIPSIAGAHHEKLDGSGYPLSLGRDDLSLQARILAVADIFEALSASDRPYKKPMKLSQTIDVLTRMADQNKIDKDLVTLLVHSGTGMAYARKYLSEEQIDM